MVMVAMGKYDPPDSSKEAKKMETIKAVEKSNGSANTPPKATK
jgi:hypothetical protein